MFSLNGKTALITGSGRGIGLAIAEAMAHQGANIFLSDINGAIVERAAGDLAEKARTAWCVTPEDVIAAFPRVFSQLREDRT